MRMQSRFVKYLAAVALALAATTTHAASLCVGGQPNRNLQGAEQCDLGGENQNDCCDDECRFRPANASCDDQNACTSRDVSLPVGQRDHCDGAGQCVGGQPVSCDDDEECTVDACHPNRAEGNQCSHQKRPVGTACQGAGEACCSFGSCSSAGVCAVTQGCAQTADPCDADMVCDPSSCQCEPGALPSGRACEDGDQCSEGDTCSDGACVPGAPRVCDDGEICTLDVCDPATGCRTVPHAVPSAVRCDGELTQCLKGVCGDSSGADKMRCVAAGPIPEPGTACTLPATACTAAEGTCSTVVSGWCVPTPINEGGPCPGLAGVCRLPDQATCQSGSCVTPNRPQGTICDDGNACTDASACQNGSCAGTSCDLGATCQNPSCMTFCGDTPVPLCGCMPTNF